jgi:hypothetical protein
VNLTPAPPSRLCSIPSGIAGVRATLQYMARMVRRYKTDAGLHQLTRNIVRGLPNQNTDGADSLYVGALHAFVRDRIQYVNDVNEVETLQTPLYTLQCGAGDCDDKATLLNAMLESCGYKSLFFAIGLDGGPFQHVLGGVLLGRRRICLETIVANVPPGWMPPNANPVLPWHV